MRMERIFASSEQQILAHFALSPETSTSPSKFRTSAVEGRLRPLRPTIAANHYGRPLPSTFPAGAAAEEGSLPIPN
ncbi:uncharacterized protein CCOS01_08484 [Colletotrichum costaricense]|uniref:Uncharacterized protein n=1 Tax=Colletotrichum costaricense TaxID=1209916 RepID=A0AAI9YVQ9_9PEZI|nr:uncharacterized protein CCOS01_08484 [Colletotrichum costaricense]KAK1526066.1 hypothetical protein CCOS01_08484 [Colletotrichum costaricense]